MRISQTRKDLTAQEIGFMAIANNLDELITQMKEINYHLSNIVGAIRGEK